MATSNDFTPAGKTKATTEEQAENKLSSELTITYQPLADLKDNPHNSRTHPKRQIHQIAKSIKHFGLNRPILVDKNNTIIAGHALARAAKVLGITEVPTIRLENLSPDQIRAYGIADNRLAELAGWDTSILAIELQHLLSIDTDFDITATGFEIPEIDMLLSPADDKPDLDDVFEVAESGDAVSKPGDLWQLGRHRLLCGSGLRRITSREGGRSMSRSMRRFGCTIGCF